MEEEREQLKELLNLQIALVKPKIIVVLGSEVAETLLDRDVKLGEEREYFRVDRRNKTSYHL